MVAVEMSDESEMERSDGGRNGFTPTSIIANGVTSSSTKKQGGCSPRAWQSITVFLLLTTLVFGTAAGILYWQLDKALGDVRQLRSSVDKLESGESSTNTGDSRPLLTSSSAPSLATMSASAVPSLPSSSSCPPCTCQTPSTPSPTSSSSSDCVFQTEVSQGSPVPSLFQPLSSDEMEAVNKFGQSYLTNSLKRTTAGISHVELLPPVKQSAILHLDHGGSRPPREALIHVKESSTITEYVVGPIPSPTYMYANNRTTAHTYSVNAGTTRYFVDLANQVKRELEYVIVESWGGCGASCYSIRYSVGGVKFISASKYVWFRFFRTRQFDMLYPIDLNIRVNSTAMSVDGVYYNGQLFRSVSDFRSKYDNNQLRKVLNHEPKNDYSQMYGLKPEEGDSQPGKRPPKSILPDGHRYSVSGYHVTSDNWSMDVGMRAHTGAQLFDIRFQGERILYEASLQEIAVVYSGYGPGGAYSTLVDSPYQIGSNSFALALGVDCPEHATMIDYDLWTGRSGTNIRNSACVFESATDLPIRRHVRGTKGNPYYYSGLPGTVLVYRTASVLYNYDYIIDFKFYPNGAIEIAAASTGFILSHAFNEAERNYAFEVAPGVAGTVHDHFFHFKMDLDIKGRRNSFETVSVNAVSTPNPFLPDVPSMVRKQLSRKTSQTEKDTPVVHGEGGASYYLMYNSESRNQFGNFRSYRLVVEGSAPQQFGHGVNGETSLSWARYALAVTKRHETEPISHSGVASLAAAAPPIVFQDFLDNDESTRDQDLVAWATVGLLHIPHTEDLPVTHTPGLQKKILLLPYNYFDIDASAHSKDQVHWSPRDGAIRFTKQGEECSQPQRDIAAQLGRGKR